MAAKVIQFEEFELDSDRYELRRGDRSLKLEKMPMELLILLADKRGHLVSRDEIAARLWGSEVYVDSEHGINTAIRKIRQALRDDPEQPRFIQTVQGKGYRFIAPVAAAEKPTANGHGGGIAHASAAPVVEDPELVECPAPAIDTPATEAIAPPPADREHANNTRQSHAGRWLAAVGVLAVILPGVGLNRHRFLDWFSSRSAPQIQSLAVLPLDNLSGDPAQNYLADGMTDELITMLAKNSTLRIISRTSVMQYKGVHRPLPEIARELNVDGILEGSLSRSGTGTHMTIQLIRAASDTHIWAESYDRDAGGLVSLPREAAQSIAGQLHRTVTETAPQQYVSPEAHDAFLRGRYEWFAGNNVKAGEYLKRTTELQPDYALGWSYLSAYYVVSAMYGETRPRDSTPLAEAAALKAIQLDDTLAEAHNSMAAVYFFRHWDLDRANAEVVRAITLDPKFAEAYHLHAKILATMNRMDEAIHEEKKHMDLDPFARPWALAATYISAHKCDVAQKEALQRMDAQPGDATLHWVLSDAYWCRGMVKEAGEEYVKSALTGPDKTWAAAVQRAYDGGGYQGILQLELSSAEKKAATGQYVYPIAYAWLYAHMGRKEETLRYLEESYNQREPYIVEMQNEPAYDFLHGDARYRALVKKIGLSPMY